MNRKLIALNVPEPVIREMNIRKPADERGVYFEEPEVTFSKPIMSLVVYVLCTVVCWTDSDYVTAA
jgi:hypothetical protein